MFDLTNVKDDSVLEAGLYYAQVEKAELKKTRDGTGEYINVMFNILGPKAAGKKVFSMYNVKNRNEQAVNIGLSQLKQLAQSANIPLTSVTPQALIGAVVDITLGVRGDEFGMKNVVKKHSPSTKNALPKEEVPF